MGIHKSMAEGTPGAFPDHDEEHIVCKDITKWRETVHAPRLDYSDAEWEPFIKEAEKIDRNEYFVTQFIAPGIFEQCHYLQEIQNALINFYEEPEYTQELIDYLQNGNSNMQKKSVNILNRMHSSITMTGEARILLLFLLICLKNLFCHPTKKFTAIINLMVLS